MSVRVLEGEYDGGEQRAVMVCGTTSTAFGPLFADADEVLAFLAWFPAHQDHGVGDDPREYNDEALAEMRQRFLADGANDG